MTNEEREALIAQGWTPPEPVDPDLAKAKYLAQTARAERLTSNTGIYDLDRLALAAIKRGRELERAEAKPGMVWVKHEQSSVSPAHGSLVIVRFHKGHYETGQSCMFDWWKVDHYAIITQPEDAA